MQEHILKCDNFCLRFRLYFYESDIEYPINSNMTVVVTFNEFSAKADIDIDIKRFAEFSMELMDIYKSLEGEASIKEPYGYERYITFVADRKGHIVVKGFLCDDSRSNELRFKTVFDQTHLKVFAEELALTYSKYKKQI